MAPTRIVNGLDGASDRVTNSTSSKDFVFVRRVRFATFGFASIASPSLPSFQAHHPSERSE